MKFKPLYFYGAIAVVVIIILIVVSQQGESDNRFPKEVTTQQNPPDDEIHNPLKSGESPSKDNVSEGFRHRLEMLRKSIEENPGDTTKLKVYADLLAGAHMMEQSVEFYEKILAINPKRTDILFSLSFIYYSLGNLDKAEIQTNKILIIAPRNVNAQYNLGAIAAGKGEKERAKEIWSKIVQQYPEDEVGKKAANSIQKL
jgi:tetratricopeptide (TPR) repeat protein